MFTFVLNHFGHWSSCSNWIPEQQWLGYKAPELPSLPLPLTWAYFFPASGEGSQQGTETAFASMYLASSKNMSLLELCLSFLKLSVAAASEVIFALCKLSLTQASMPRVI